MNPPPGRVGLHRSLTPYVWVMPAVVLYFVFKLAPLIGGVYLALLRWDGIEPATFVGLDNFVQIFHDKLIASALMNNIKFAIGTVVGKTVLSLLLALLLNQGIRGRGFYRTALFTPVVISMVVVGLLWSWIYNPQFGLLNDLLRLVGMENLILDWLGGTKVALWSLMVVEIWKWYGFHMVIFLAGLQTIPEELYEVARIDGASRLRRLASITLPLLQPTMLINVTLALMGALNVFDIPYVMTAGGPANSTMVMALHIYIRGFRYGKFGYGTAMSYALLLFVTVVAGIQMRLMWRPDNQ